MILITSPFLSAGCADTDKKEEDSKEVGFEDKAVVMDCENLKQKLREEIEFEFEDERLSMPEALADLELLASDIKQLETLSIEEEDHVTGLKGLEPAQSLRYQVIHDSIIDSTAPLQGLDSLKKSIEIRRTRSQEPICLANINKLSTLVLMNGKVFDLGFLKEVKTLKKLNLSNNPIEEAEELSVLQELQELDVSNNNIALIQSLSRLEKLHTLYLQKNQVVDLTPLSSRKILKKLALCGNPIDSLSR